MLLGDVEDVVREARSVEPIAFEVSALRAHRARLQMVEAQVSFVRRVAQVRLDLLLAARDVHHADDVTGRRLDVLLAALPDLVVPRVSSGPARPPGDRQLVRPDAELLSEAEQVATVDIGEVANMPPDAIDEAVERVVDYEHRVSTVRQELHELLDAVQSEIARRYRCGELTVG